MKDCNASCGWELKMFMHERHVRLLSVVNNKQNRYIPAASKHGEPRWLSEALLWWLWSSSSSLLFLIPALAIKRSPLWLCSPLGFHKGGGRANRLGMVIKFWRHLIPCCIESGVRGECKLHLDPLYPSKSNFPRTSSTASCVGGFAFL